MLGKALVISYSMAVKDKTTPVAHEGTSSFSFMTHGNSMILIMIPQAEDVLILVGGIVGGKAHLLNVPLGEGVPHFFCIACFHGSMRICMATMIDHLSLCKVSHMFVGNMPLICIGEEFFYGLPSWEVIHFILMTTWRWESFMDHENPHDCHHFYLEEAMDKQEGFHIDLPFFHDESDWVYSPRANFHIEEGLLEDITIAENSEQWWRLLDEEATREEGEILQHPCSFLRTSNILEGEAVIFLN